MSEIDLGQTIGILANVGVIIGILFLALEIRQNNSQLRAQSRFSYFQTRIHMALVSASDPIISPILAKRALGQGLSPEEEVQISFFANATLDAWRYEILEYESGRLRMEELDIARKRAIFNLPALRPVFDQALEQPGWPVGFKEFLKEQKILVSE